MLRLMNATQRPAVYPRAATVVCFVIPLLLYATTAARTVQGGDTGEFACVAMLGGVAHPPGYPVYSLLARAVGHLVPFGPLFWRVAMASAFCGAATCAVLLAVMWRVTGRVGASMLAALAFALSPLEWRLAGVPEVFTLHALASACVLLFSLRLAESERGKLRRDGFALGLVCGLGLANHQTLLLLFPLVFWAVASVLRREGRAALKVLPGLAGGGLVGLSAYLLLPLFAHFSGPESLVWGRTDTWQGFMTHVLREEYGTFRLHTGVDASAATAALQIRTFADELVRQNMYLFALVGVVGVVVAFGKKRGFAGALLAAFLLAGVGFSALLTLDLSPIQREVAARFHLMPQLLFSVFVAEGLASLEARLRPGVFGTVGGLLLLGSVVVAWRDVDWARDASIENFTRGELDAMAPQSLVLGVGDGHDAEFAWEAYALGLRHDVHYVDPNMATLPWYQVRKQLEIPGLPLPAVRVKAGALATTMVSHGFTTYLAPTIVPSDREPARLEPAGFLDRVVGPQTAPLPLEEAELRLQKATDLFAPALPVVDAWSEVVYLQARTRWLDLAENYRLAGRDDRFTACALRGLKVLPQ